MRRVFTTNDIALSHSDYVALTKEGKVNLGVDDDVANRALSAGAGPKSGGASAAFHFYSWLAIGVFAVSVYYSFTHAWWWFIAGFFGMRAIWSANKQSGPASLLDAALYDEEFYERFRSAGVWRYDMSEEDAKRYIV